MERNAEQIIYFCALVTVLLNGAYVQASATFEVRMVKFENPSGDKGNGECCDKYVVCVEDCDNQFTFCLDQFRSPPTTDHEVCSHGQSKTGEFSEGNNINFGADMQGVANPISIQLEREDKVVLKVYVVDNDPDNKYEWLDTLTGQLLVSRFGRTSGIQWTQTELQGDRAANPTKLSLEYRGYCNANYYGQLCEVYCVAKDSVSEGHYTCDRFTGDIECRDGWVDPSSGCRTPDDPCTPGTCLNGGTCLGGNGAFTCTCPQPYTGATCEMSDECIAAPCQNRGMCTPIAGDFSCACSSNFTGRLCEVFIADACDSQPCMNNGACSSMPDGYTCQCSPGFVGRQCADVEDPCVSQPCINGGTCISADGQGSCLCLQNFTGETCQEELPCRTECFNGGSCGILGECQCMPCYSGAQCATNICTTGSGGESAPTTDNSTSLTIWIAVGVSIGVVLLAIALVVVFCVIRSKKRAHATKNGTPSGADGPIHITELAEINTTKDPPGEHTYEEILDDDSPFKETLDPTPSIRAVDNQYLTTAETTPSQHMVASADVPDGYLCPVSTATVSCNPLIHATTGANGRDEYLHTTPVSKVATAHSKDGTSNAAGNKSCFTMSPGLSSGTGPLQDVTIGMGEEGGYVPMSPVSTVARDQLPDVSVDAATVISQTANTGDKEASAAVTEAVPSPDDNAECGQGIPQ